MVQVTISWQPGAVKGRSIQQTDAMIIKACQYWQMVSGIQFIRGPFGYPTTFTIYPWSKPMAGAMVAYPATRQILYSTIQQYPHDWWTIGALGHELGHCVGWGHVDPKLAEHLMNPKGSNLYYFTAAEARRARQQFGQPRSKYKPVSITWLQGEIKRLKALKPVPTKDVQAREAQLKRVQAEWKALDGITHTAFPVPENSIRECFGKSKKLRVASQDWQSVFAELRSSEYMEEVKEATLLEI